MKGTNRSPCARAGKNRVGAVAAPAANTLALNAPFRTFRRPLSSGFIVFSLFYAFTLLL